MTSATRKHSEVHRDTTPPRQKRTARATRLGAVKGKINRGGFIWAAGAKRIGECKHDELEDTSTTQAERTVTRTESVERTPIETENTCTVWQSGEEVE